MNSSLLTSIGYFSTIISSAFLNTSSELPPKNYSSYEYREYYNFHHDLDTQVFPVYSDTSTTHIKHILQEGGAMLLKKKKNLTAINNMRNFSDNWNGYGAKGFSPDLCDFLEKIIKSLDEEIQPKVFPTGRESIQIEYEKQNGEYLEIEIFSEKRIELFQVLENEEEIEKNITFDEIEGLVKTFNGIQG